MSATEELTAAFRSFDKWPTYGLAYAMLTDGRATITDIVRAGALAGIEPAVVRMRMADFAKMSGL